MYQVPFVKMVCDTDYGDGGVYFYEQYLEWASRGSGKGFKIYYKNIVDTQVLLTQKKTIKISTKSGNVFKFYLYKVDTFMRTLNDMMDKAKREKTEEPTYTEEDALSKLERLAKLHDSGALTDEEFAKAKELILK